MPEQAVEPNMAAAKEILMYFLNNPGAADTLTEIARWRLMQETIRRSVEATEKAMNWLLGEGYLHVEARVGADRIFQLNPARRDDAEAFLTGKRADGARN